MPTDVPAVGDSLRDIQAAARAGAKPILVRTGNGERTIKSSDFPKNVPIFEDLAAVADAMIRGTH